MIRHHPDAVVHVLKAMLHATESMSFADEDDTALTSSKRAFQTALGILLSRERDGTRGVRRRCEEASALLADIGEETLARTAAMLAGRVGEMPQRDAEAAIVDLLHRAERAMVDDGAVLAEEDLRRLCLAESAELESMAGAGDLARGEDFVRITRDRLECYLRDRLGDPTVTVAALDELPGGFGKETLLFTVRGASLDGEFVIRRDPAVEVLPGACHRVRAEFEVVRAVRAKGFPAPDALWLETGHPLLPGPDFMVMRRSPGSSAGTLQGSTTQFEPALSDALGTVLGRLHSLPPLTGLGDLTETIRTDLWRRPASDALRDYLIQFQSMLLDEPHAPSPATIALLNWLMARIPETGAPSCLIHGDVGFHNMLVDRGELQVLLDWENAQIGHPGQDLGYVYNAVKDSVDWPRIMRAYSAAGGTPPDARTLLYFRILAVTRIAVTTNVGPSHLFAGEVGTLRLINAEAIFRPAVLRQAAALVAEYAAAYETEGA